MGNGFHPTRITVESDRAGSALRIHELFQQNPFHTANQVVQITGLSAPTVNAALADLERLGSVDEVTGRKRGRVLSYRYNSKLGHRSPASQFMKIGGPTVPPSPTLQEPASGRHWHFTSSCRDHYEADCRTFDNLCQTGSQWTQMECTDGNNERIPTGSDQGLR
nr:winged helix-turn-helix transcriptional regulator [Rhizobium sp. AN80A]